MSDEEISAQQLETITWEKLIQILKKKGSDWERTKQIWTLISVQCRNPPIKLSEVAQKVLNRVFDRAEKIHKRIQEYTMIKELELIMSAFLWCLIRFLDNKLRPQKIGRFRDIQPSDYFLVPSDITSPSTKFDFEAFFRDNRVRENDLREWWRKLFSKALSYNNLDDEGRDFREFYDIIVIVLKVWLQVSMQRDDMINSYTKESAMNFVAESQFFWEAKETKSRIPLVLLELLDALITPPPPPPPPQEMSVVWAALHEPMIM